MNKIYGLTKTKPLTISKKIYIALATLTIFTSLVNGLPAALNLSNVFANPTIAQKITSGTGTLTIIDTIQYNTSKTPSEDVVKLTADTGSAKGAFVYGIDMKPTMLLPNNIAVWEFKFDTIYKPKSIKSTKCTVIPGDQGPGSCVPNTNAKSSPYIQYTQLPLGQYTVQSYGDAGKIKTQTVNNTDVTASIPRNKSIFYNISTISNAASSGGFQPVEPSPNLPKNALNFATVSTSSQSNQSTKPTLKPTCETQSGQVLSWIFCPLINGLASASTGVFTHIVQPLLQTQPIDLSTTNPIYKAWSAFRIYGDIVLVITLLVMVFGEAIGGGLVSAYTVKKVLPRLLVAAILLNLSIYIVAMAADVANIVGKDVGYLITTPFASAGGNNIKFNTITGIFGTLSTVVLGGAIWGAGMAFIPLFLLFVLLPVLLTVVAILVTVVLRQAIIVLLVIVSPVAFALYCLPNTEKYFKQWWDTLLKTLLVYPIVTVIFAAAEVASFILGQILSKTSDTVTAHLANLMAFVAMIIPLFLVPFSFKIAGGLVGSIYGTLNNLGKKAQTAIKGNPNNPESLQNRTKREAAANLASHNLSSRAIGTRLNPTTVFGRRRRERRLPKLASIRETAQGIYGKQGMAAQAYEQSKDKSEVMGDLALYGSKEESLAAARLEHQTGLQEANQKYATNLQNAHNDLSQRLSSNLITRGQYDSEKMQTDRDLALQHDQDIQSVNDRLQQRLAASSTADIIGRNNYMRRRALMNPATIGYALAGGEEGWNQATSVMKSIAGDDVNMYRSMINEFQFIAKNVGRSDLSGNTDSDVYDLERAWDTQSPAQIAANAKPSSMKAFANGFVKQMQESMSILQTRPPSDPKLKEALEQKVISSLRFYKELDVVLGSQPTGGIRNEVLKAKQAFKAANVDAILHQTTTDGSDFNRKAQSGVRSVDLRTRGQDTGGSSGSEGSSE